MVEVVAQLRDSLALEEACGNDDRSFPAASDSAGFDARLRSVGEMTLCCLYMHAPVREDWIIVDAGSPAHHKLAARGFVMNQYVPCDLFVHCFEFL